MHVHLISFTSNSVKVLYIEKVFSVFVIFAVTSVLVSFGSIPFLCWVIHHRRLLRFMFDLIFLSQRAYPYVSVMLGNGTLVYDHDKDGRPTELGGCTAMIRNSIYDSFLLLRYSKNKLTVLIHI